jgi:hypothetical protein
MELQVRYSRASVGGLAKGNLRRHVDAKHSGETVKGCDVCERHLETIDYAEGRQR